MRERVREGACRGGSVSGRERVGEGVSVRECVSKGVCQ